MTRKDRIAARFGAAQGYEQAARVQHVVARELACRIAARHAPGDMPPARILEIGCGTGFLTRELRRLFPTAHITATDIAPAMLERVARRMANDDRLSLHRMDAEAPDVEGPFDLICSSMAMQWFPHRARTLRMLGNLLAPGGQMALSTLCLSSFRQWRDAYARAGVVCPMPDYPTIEQLQAEWPACGAGMWHDAETVDTPATPLAFVQELRAIGATHTDYAPATGGQLRRVLAAAGTDGPFTVSYQVGYGLFRRAAWPGVFVTGTDTDVGKTVTSATLVRAWDAAYWKPLQSGTDDAPSDSMGVRQLTGLDPARLYPPAATFGASLSPEDAAHAAHTRIDPAMIALPRHAASDGPLVVEGAGGVFVPIAENYLMIDLMARLALPVVLVARSQLGTINHTLLSLAALRARGLHVAGVILNGPPEPYGRSAIERHGRVRILAEFPTITPMGPDAVAQLAARLPAWEQVARDAP
ncbi:ATP-dependent dethiobiotin synthetase BioD 1 [Komagataeibacter europaeus]|uniref:ATP-dependent dethiobiotin synthetase BioD n=1 Tax=Komagataeibacter europaeus TaxID=33995 RepID=A0A0M0EL26_KOMEU|nr:dethiobiotin synthase [Komagataeibacter europaeus]KON65952.1 ATP-dependent dethiobiotin synthetase BioD 1 [Komagataeibacter europaeus]GBQ38313.1 biotin synthesis protein [Komagataeibacter europaeus LMG 18890]